MECHFWSYGSWAESEGAENVKDIFIGESARSSKTSLHVHQNCLGWLEFADLYNLQDVATAAKKIIQKHCNDVGESDAFLLVLAGGRF